MRVLYVEDEPAVGRVVRTWLTRLGYDVHVADSVASARAQLTDMRFDGAVIDVHLRDESGLELQIWLEEADPELARRTVFVSGDVIPDGPVGDMLRRFGKPVIAKPFAFGDLERAIDEWGLADPS
jgi:DNA-binding response OmpR family regulator